jgi:disulfide bond formation protein DsbB
MAVRHSEPGDLLRRAAVAAVLGLALSVWPAAGHAAQPAAAAGQRADFNGDGFDDLAIGAAFEDLSGVLDAGAVNVLYGSASGLATRGAQLWTQDSPGVPGTAQQAEFFGVALAAGDFDADGFGDLAIGIQRDRDGGVGAGAVQVLYGSARGLTASRAQLWTQDSPGVPEDSEFEDEFGTALAARDLNDDRATDLAVGVPGEDLGTAADAGAVVVLYGAQAAGLTATGAQLWTQDSPGVPGAAELGDIFGHALAIGDVDGDGSADLAVGASGESVGAVTNAGAVNLLLGSAAGLVSRGAQLFTQNSPGVPGLAEPFDQLGFAVALGDADHDGFADLAAGVVVEDVGTVADAGAVQVLYGSAAGLTATGSQLWTQNNPGVPDQAEVDDDLGFSVALGDADGDGFADLAAGAIGESVGNVGAAGAVAVLPGSAAGLTAVGSRLLTQDSPGVPGTAEILDQLGFGVAVGDFDGDGLADAAAGARSETVGPIAHAGAVNVLYGSAAGLTGSGGQLFTQDSPGVPGAAEPDDLFGSALAAES